MWTSDVMTFWESMIAFFIGFSIVFACLIAIALFIVVSSKIIGSFVKEEVPAPVKTIPTATSKKPVVAAAPAANEGEVENLAVIIAAISEEMRESVENFQIISVKEI